MLVNLALRVDHNFANSSHVTYVTQVFQTRYMLIQTKYISVGIGIAIHLIEYIYLCMFQSIYWSLLFRKYISFMNFHSVYSRIFTEADKRKMEGGIEHDDRSKKNVKNSFIMYVIRQRYGTHVSLKRFFKSTIFSSVCIGED